MNDLIYNATGLGFSYRTGEMVLRDIDFQLSPGEMVGIIGPNGAGKSTLLKLLSKLLEPSTGQLNLFGKPMSGLDPIHIALKISYLPQESEIHFPFTAGEVVMLGRWPHSGGAFFDSVVDREISSRAMQRVGIGGWENKLVTEMSGGERARVLLAKALAAEPSCLLLDEPVSELDLKNRTEAYSLIRSVADSGTGVVVVAHEIGAVSRWVDRLVLFGMGSIIADGTPDQVLTESNLEKSYGVKTVIISHGPDRAIFPVTGNTGGGVE